MHAEELRRERYAAELVAEQGRREAEQAAAHGRHEMEQAKRELEAMRAQMAAQMAAAVVQERVEARRAMQEEQKEAMLCSVCMDAAKDCMLNCGHLQLCMGCAPALDVCPICRASITNRTKVFADMRS